MRLTVSILEDDAHHVSLSAGVFVHQPQWLHFGVHKPALVCAARPNTLSVKHKIIATLPESKEAGVKLELFFFGGDNSAKEV